MPEVQVRHDRGLCIQTTGAIDVSCELIIHEVFPISEPAKGPKCKDVTPKQICDAIAARLAPLDPAGPPRTIGLCGGEGCLCDTTKATSSPGVNYEFPLDWANIQVTLPGGSPECYFAISGTIRIKAGGVKLLGCTGSPFRPRK